MEPGQQRRHVRHDDLLGCEPARTLRCAAAVGPPAAAAGEGLVLQEALGLEALDVGAEDRGVEVQLPVGDHEAVPLAEELAPDHGVFGDVPDGSGEGGHPDGFIPGGVQAGALFQQIVGAGCRRVLGEGGLDLFD